MCGATIQDALGVGWLCPVVDDWKHVSTLPSERRVVIAGGTVLPENDVSRAIARDANHMEPEIVVALLSLVGTLGGSFLGVLASNKLINYRIQQLEKKVEKHNNLVERMVLVETEVKSAQHRLDSLEHN